MGRREAEEAQLEGLLCLSVSFCKCCYTLQVVTKDFDLGNELFPFWEE